MKNIVIDIETKSDKDIMKCGVYAYTDTPYFDILLFAYSIDGQPVQVVDTANGEEIPENVLAVLADENVVKRAFNCNFERVCLSKHLRENDPQYFRSYSIDEDTVGDYLSPENWHCSMIHARTLGLPSSLAEVGKVLGIEQQKMTEGKALIKFFCTPYDTIDGVPQFHNPKDYPEKWEIFKAYNKRDVEAELEIDRKLSRFPVPDFIWQEFYLDQEINDRGILVDMQLADKAISLDEEAKEELTTEMQRLTGVENPNSVYQLLDWLETQGYKSDSLGKAQVQELIKTAKEPVKSVLQMRLQLSKSSVKKYQAMKIAKCEDKRVRGMFSFYGASRTGRFCSKIIQIQNLPQNHLPDLSEARELVKYGSFEDVQMLYDDVPDTLSQLIRTAFIPRPNMKFIVADFSAIEARVIAWLAGEEWRMQAFANGEDIYCASASKMFGVPVVKHGVNGHLRQKGKVAELACIAEGQFVLTNHGLKPIERVSVSDKVWDGVKWIPHQGVIYKGKELKKRGYDVPETAEPESTKLTVQMPADFFTEHTLNNLHQICENKAVLFQAAFKTDSLDIIQSDDKVEFPWFTIENDGDADAYCTFISMLCEFAKNQKRINSKPDTSDNPKYTMRCYLLRLGMIGAEYKSTRKVLLRNLSGSSAFRKAANDEVSE